VQVQRRFVERRHKGEGENGAGLQQSYEKYVGFNKNYGGFINDSNMNFMLFYKEDLNA